MSTAPTYTGPEVEVAFADGWRGAREAVHSLVMSEATESQRLYAAKGGAGQSPKAEYLKVLANEIHKLKAPVRSHAMRSWARRRAGDATPVDGERK